MTAAFIDVQQNPENAKKYENNPKIKNVMDKLSASLGAAGMGRDEKGGAGAGPGATSGARSPPAASRAAQPPPPPPTASAGDMDLD